MNTKYFWIATFSWPVAQGFAMIDGHGTFEPTGPVSRARVLDEVKEIFIRDKGMPENATVLYFSVERDEVK